MKRELGFTITELLMCIAVIGALAALALPEYSQYRTRAFDLRAKADLKSAIAGQETLVAGGGDYVACSNAECTVALPAFMLSPGVRLSMAPARDGNTFAAQASHLQGAVSYFFDSAEGIFHEEDPNVAQSNESGIS